MYAHKSNEVKMKVLDLIDQAFDLMDEYDSLPHKYGEVMLYQREAKVIEYLGNHERSTITDIARFMGKTPSMYSQIIRKLRSKGWVEQLRNDANNREYYLYLTESGKQVFKDHNMFEQSCYERTFEKISCFSDEELETYCRVQEMLNEAFKMDIEDSYKFQDLSSFKLSKKRLIK